MDYEKKYNNALEWARLIKEGKIGFVLSEVEKVFPELQESEDERVRKGIIELVKQSSEILDRRNQEQMIAWLEKQGESDKSLYIRFGDIPTNGRSKVYNGEIETGIEEGISVYPAFEDKEGNIVLGLNLPITKTSLHTQQHLLEYDNRPCYLVTGDYVGKGNDGEPLIKNVRIIKEIKPYKIKKDKENNTYTIYNTPNCGISVCNEELKSSEDERIRKAILNYFTKCWGNCEDNVCGIHVEDVITWLEMQDEKPQGKSALEAWKDMRLEVYQQASGNRHEPNYSDDTTKMFSLNDIDEIFEKIAELQEENSTDNVEQKFHEGDWIIHQGTENIYQVVAVIDNQYQIRYGDNYTIQKCDDVDRHARLLDAKKMLDKILNNSYYELLYNKRTSQEVGYYS